MTSKPQNKGSKFEKKVQRTIASGSMWFDKGDLKEGDNYIECKYTDKMGFRVSLKLLEETWAKALNRQKEPHLVIGIKRNEKEIFVLEGRLRLERKI